MKEFVAGASLRLKFTAFFVLIVIGGTVISTAIGTRIITRTLLDQARGRVRYGLEVARTGYQDRLEGVRTSLSAIASSEEVLEAVRARHSQRIGTALVRSRVARGLFFLRYVDAGTGQVMPASTTRSVETSRVGAAVHEALAGASVAWSDVLGRDEMAYDPPARRPREGGDGAAGSREPEEGASSLALVAAVPVKSGSEVVGALYGGVLLSGNVDIVERVRKLVFGGEQYEGRDVGVVSIFLEDVRVADVLARGEGPGFESRAAPEVSRAVLQEGRSWHGRVFVANEWHVAAYEPIRDRVGHVIGMLSVGMREAPLLAVRSHVMLTFYAVAAVGVVVVLALTFFLVGKMVHPLEHMVEATKKIAAGDLHPSIHVTSRDEIGHLAESFNAMLQSLRTMKAELQSWAHTLEEKVQQRTDELATVQSRMAQSEKLASIGRLAAGVAHEINNPLGGILSVAMLGVEERDERDPIRADLEIIVKQTLRCREIVKGLLDFSRQSESRVVRTDVNPIIENTLSLLQRQAIFQNVRTTRKLERALPPVLIDPGQLQEVVMNIVINAVDAMEESGDLVVETALDHGASEIAIRISDTGKGIPDDVLPFIFEPFFTTKKVGQGTGLGLSIAHGIVSRAGGRIEVKSSRAGTTFTVQLPVAMEDAPADLTEQVG